MKELLNVPEQLSLLDKIIFVLIGSKLIYQCLIVTLILD